MEYDVSKLKDVIYKMHEEAEHLERGYEGDWDDAVKESYVGYLHDVKSALMEMIMGINIMTTVCSNLNEVNVDECLAELDNACAL